MKPVHDATVAIDYGDTDFHSIGGLSRGINYLCARSRVVRWHLRRGKVVEVGLNPVWGKYVIVQRFIRRHYLCNLSEVHVVIGQRVKRGTVIGMAGLTGQANYPNVYYEVRRWPYEPGSFVRPTKYVR